jgi:hypothetical protein
MNENLNSRENPDDGRIRVNLKADIDYWTNELKISEQTLMTAVQMVGPRVKDVREWLKNHGYPR